MSLLLWLLASWPVLAAAPEVPTSSGRPWWEYLLRAAAVVGLGYGAWITWRNRKRP